jgi:hypothetical protein
MDDRCPICLESLEINTITLPCNHTFHVYCINEHFLHNHTNCPMCRRIVLPNPINPINYAESIESWYYYKNICVSSASLLGLMTLVFSFFLILMLGYIKFSKNTFFYWFQISSLPIVLVLGMVFYRIGCRVVSKKTVLSIAGVLTFFLIINGCLLIFTSVTEKEKFLTVMYSDICNLIINIFILGNVIFKSFLIPWKVRMYGNRVAIIV